MTNVFSAKEYLQTIADTFPFSTGLMRYLFIDACYDFDDVDEQEAFATAIESLWLSLEFAPPLPTVNVKKVQTENKKLQEKIEEKENLLLELERNRQEEEKRFATEMENNRVALENLRRENKITECLVFN